MPICTAAQKASQSMDLHVTQRQTVYLEEHYHNYVFTVANKSTGIGSLHWRRSALCNNTKILFRWEFLSRPPQVVGLLVLAKGLLADRKVFESIWASKEMGNSSLQCVKGK